METFLRRHEVSPFLFLLIPAFVFFVQTSTFIFCAFKHNSVFLHHR